MTRHRLMVTLDLDDEDQTDEETVKEILEYWIARGRRSDLDNTGAYWPPCGPPTAEHPGGDPDFNWQVTYRGTSIIRKEGVDG